MTDPALVAITSACLLGGIWVLKRYFSSLYATSKPSPPAAYGTTASSSSFSLQNAMHSFQSYASVATSEANAYRSKFNTLRGAHRRLAVEVGYPAKIEMLRVANETNSHVTRAIYRLATAEFPNAVVVDASMGRKSIHADVGRVRESLKHLVRDWSMEGVREREVIFAPILAQLNKIPLEKRAAHKILVPGAGLGRLAWEVANMGFDMTSCELSYYMNLSLRFLLSPEATTAPNQHTVCPYGHWLSHQRFNQNTFRGITVPDVLPRRMQNWTILEEDFLGLSHPLTGVTSSTDLQTTVRSTGYDTIITLYFIDTASNIISYLMHIHHLLRPGGTWINLGPLLYSSATIELCLDEVLKLATSIGFDVEETSLQQVPSEYTADTRAMMKWVYLAQFWVATKRSDDLRSEILTI